MMAAETAKTLRLNPRDSVDIALADLAPGDVVGLGPLKAKDAIPRGHKVAIAPIPAGMPIYKFGSEIGIATRNIAAGAHVHSHNLEFRPVQSNRAIGTERRNMPILAESEAASFLGIERADGSIGTRNYLGVLTTVNCSATVGKQIAEHFRRSVDLSQYPAIDGVVALSHQHGCSFREDGMGMEILRRTLSGYAHHPNFAGVLVVGLGCEDNQVHKFLDLAGLSESPRVKPLIIQEEGGTLATVKAGVAKLSEMLPEAAAVARRKISARHLRVGLQCGGSDGFSGLSANPALGRAVDLLVHHGGGAILSETPEIYGAESMLLKRAVSPEIGQKLIDLLAWWEDYARQDKGTLDNNPSPGNKQGGLTTILEKSLGAVAKAGSTDLVGVYRYAEPIDRQGLVFMDSPGYDPVSATGQVAAGANLVCFTTGRGSCYGCKPAPSLKLATNTPMYRKMQDDMDINCGEIIDGTATIAEMGERLFRLMLATASGQKTASERLGYGDEEFIPWAIGAVY